MARLTLSMFSKEAQDGSGVPPSARFAFGHVHIGTDEFNDVAGCVENRMPDPMNVLEWSRLKNSSENHVVIGVLTDGFFQVFDQPASILRMNALKKCLNCGIPARGSNPYRQ